MKAILQASIRQHAIYIPGAQAVNTAPKMSETTSILTINAARLGFTFTEPLLHALDQVKRATKLEIIETLKEVTGAHKNWTPLVKGWETPTGESHIDHLKTFFANLLKSDGTKLPCGHIIPANTFPLERYNGCPFCGTPFESGKIIDYGQGSKLKVLDLWTDQDAKDFLEDLLISKTALDATQTDSLKALLSILPVPDVKIGIKETLMVVIDTLVENGMGAKASGYFSNPNEIMRYLWYKKTGLLQIVQPKTIIRKTRMNNQHINPFIQDISGKMALERKAALKLKYSRKECLAVATWLNNLEIPVEKSCEIMHPKRGMWVRFIRALRLAEYSKKEGFEKLNELMDYFYNGVYEVWQGRVDYFRLKAMNPESTFHLLKQRPGLFARSLFSNMLWFGPEETIEAFSEVADQIPARLLFTLNMYAKNYFDPEDMKSVKPLGGTNRSIPKNRLLRIYNEKQLADMKEKIEDLCVEAMKKRFAAVPNENTTMYIDKRLFDIPVSIGDRSETVQDISSALMGTKFPLEGNKIRLFMQWGKGLKAQHLDMDLSCYIAYEQKSEICSFSNLTPTGCRHSGDIRYIPDMVGTAEYIQIDVEKLLEAGAKFVTFTCNAYSTGSISPNLVVGWMDSQNPMRVSDKTGVAYDPSCVQHQVRVTQSSAKGLVFGVLDLQAREIIWLEMAFQGQLVRNLDVAGITAMIKKLKSKLTIGKILRIKAESQGLQVIQNDSADEVYDLKWANNTAAVTQLLID